MEFHSSIVSFNGMNHGKLFELNGITNGYIYIYIWMLRRFRRKNQWDLNIGILMGLYHHWIPIISWFSLVKSRWLAPELPSFITIFRGISGILNGIFFDISHFHGIFDGFQPFEGDSQWWNSHWQQLCSWVAGRSPRLARSRAPCAGLWADPPPPVSHRTAWREGHWHINIFPHVIYIIQMNVHIYLYNYIYVILYYEHKTCIYIYIHMTCVCRKLLSTI